MRDVLIRVLTDKLYVSMEEGDSEQHDAIAAIADDILAGIRETHVIVPKESTMDILSAFYEAIFEDKFDGTQAPMVGAGWDAAIAAAGKET